LTWPAVKAACAAKLRRLYLAYRRYRKGLKFLLEIATVGLVGFYAYQAWWQAYDAGITATAMHDNAVKDLRAYISVGGPPDRKMAEIDIDPKNAVTVPVYFFNGGRTPAHHFLATIRTHVVHAHDQGSLLTVINDIKRDGPHIERFEYLDNGERFNSGGPDIPANSQDVVNAQIDMTPQDLTDILNGGGKIVVPAQGPRQYPFLSIRLLGTFEYCDEFGGYHCNELDLKYDKGTKTFAANPQYMDVDCRIGPISHMPYRTRNVAVKILRRCEQPDEQDQAQREADQSAGKIFPPTP
jgi:hypothetical protein